MHFQRICLNLLIRPIFRKNYYEKLTLMLVIDNSSNAGITKSPYIVIHNYMEV